MHVVCTSSWLGRILAALCQYLRLFSRLPIMNRHSAYTKHNVTSCGAGAAAVLF